MKGSISNFRIIIFLSFSFFSQLRFPPISPSSILHMPNIQYHFHYFLLLIGQGSTFSQSNFQSGPSHTVTSMGDSNFSNQSGPYDKVCIISNVIWYHHIGFFFSCLRQSFSSQSFMSMVFGRQIIVTKTKSIRNIVLWKLAKWWPNVIFDVFLFIIQYKLS